MLELFRNNQFINSVLLLPYIVLVNLHALFGHTEAETAGLTPLANMLLLWVVHAKISFYAGVILLFIQAVLLNKMVGDHKMSKENTALPGLMYILWMAIISKGIILSSLVLANTFLIAGIYFLFDTTRLKSYIHLVFNSGFYLGLAGLIYTPYTIIIPLGIIGFYHIKQVKFIEIIQFLGGTISAFLFGLLYKYAQTGKWDLTEQFTMPTAHSWNIFDSGKWMPAIVLVHLLLFIILSIFQYQFVMEKKNILARKKNDIVYWMYAAFIISIFIFGFDYSRLICFALPAGVFAGILSADIKSRLTGEIAHLWLLMVLFAHLFLII